ncbi:MAG: hypothetical protein FWC36_10720 [Spirochaetes bacterium]|nr:hypothetical protein [Spirochaetota bacterium]
MLTTFEATSKLITDAKLLHIAGTEALLRKLPMGRWIGGSTEYFMTKDGGKVSGDLLFVTEFPFKNFSIKTYSAQDISQVTKDSFDNGFTILVIPFDSAVHKEYAQNAAKYEKMFLRNIVGWISGMNLGIPDQVPIAVKGSTGAFTDKAVALHIEVPANKTVSVNIINIFEQDTASPIINFTEEGFSAKKCLVGGKEVVLADYILKNNIDTKLPLVGDYSGSGVNISFKSIENGVVNFYAPVFSGINYRMAKSISNYESLFNKRVAKYKNKEAVFSCNCILNFLYGELENKKIEAFAGPITFGEIAYQLVNQTLVYVSIT